MKLINTDLPRKKSMAHDPLSGYISIVEMLKHVEHAVTNCVAALIVIRRSDI